jgi:hypothetical protein
MLGFKEVGIDIWRSTLVASGTWDGDVYDYQYVSTISGVVQPFSGGNGVRNEQEFSDVVSYIDTALTADVQENDELVIAGVRRERVKYVLPWDTSIIPHLEVYTVKTQWDRV